MAEAVYRFNSSRVPQEMDEIVAWLSRAGLDPKNVPIGASVVLGDSTMTIDVYLTRDGQKYVENGDIARGTVTVPLVYPPKLVSLVAIPAVPASEPTPEVQGG
jgi:hypothetical protein